MFKFDIPLFEIEGVPIKKSFFRKCRPYLTRERRYTNSIKTRKVLLSLFHGAILLPASGRELKYLKLK